MNFPPQPKETEVFSGLAKRPASRWRILCEILVVVTIFAAVLALPLVSRHHWLNIACLVAFFAAMTVFLRSRQSGWSHYGLFRPKSWWRAVWVALLLVFSVNLLVNLTLLPAVVELLGTGPDLSIFYQIRGRPTSLALLLVLTWLWAALGEEMFFRGYLMTRIAELFGSGWSGWMLGLLGSSLLFGLGHFYQGAAGMLLTGSLGLVAGIIFLATGRNLWVPILWHGFTDSFALVIIYLDKLPKAGF